MLKIKFLSHWSISCLLEELKQAHVQLESQASAAEPTAGSQMLQEELSQALADNQSIRENAQEQVQALKEKARDAIQKSTLRSRS